MSVDLRFEVEIVDEQFEEGPTRFEFRMSERDSEQLGAPTNVKNVNAGSFGQLVSHFNAHHYFRVGSEADVGPCLIDPIIIVDTENGQEWVVLEAGHCIEKNWTYQITL